MSVRLLLLSSFILLLFRTDAVSAQESGKTPAGNAVLVELFTSQGCSSCPPADKLLTNLEKELGVPVIPLSFHVDYWNYIGWKDPFSSADFSKRQREYAARISNHRGYTPQLVVHGQEHEVGSMRNAVFRKIRNVSARLRASSRPLRFTIQRKGRLLSVDIPQSGGKGLHIALYENGLYTSVPRGENHGRILRNDYVVRHLQRLVPGRIQISLPTSWKLKEMGVVIFEQDAGSMQVGRVVRTALP